MEKKKEDRVYYIDENERIYDESCAKQPGWRIASWNEVEQLVNKKKAEENA